MKNIYKGIVVSALMLMVTGCSDQLETNSSTNITEDLAVSSTSNLEKMLTASYKRLYFNPDSERLFAGLPGLQMVPEISGADIIAHDNMGGSQVSIYQWALSKTRYDGDGKNLWQMMYKLINQSNIILDNVDAAAGSDADKTNIKGQALAIRGIAYFYLITNFQKTYMIAKDKPGVLIRLSSTDEIDIPRDKTVQDCYNQIISDLTSAISLLDGFEQPNKWTIDKYIASGMLARTYLVMNEWQKCYDAAKVVYDKYPNLMSKEQWTHGFDDAISTNNPEVAWAMKYTSTDNLGGSTQFNFWHNVDSWYGEDRDSGPIYGFLNFFIDPEYLALFDGQDYRATVETDVDVVNAQMDPSAPAPFMVWKRNKNGDAAISSKWAYNKFKYYGSNNGAVGGSTYPEVNLMRTSEMLLMMAEAKANLGDAPGAITLLNELQTARDVMTPTTGVTGQDLLDAIYIERRKELLGEGVTGAFDLIRLQKPLVRKAASAANNQEGHYTWGLHFLDGYNASEAQPTGTIPANDYRFIMQIPEYEIINNKALTEADQNPFSGQ